MRPAAFGSTTRYRIATGSFLPPTSWLENSILPFSLIASCSSEPQLRVSSGDLQATPVARGVPGVEIHSAARTDTARGVFGSARLGGWGRNLVDTAGRDWANARLAADWSVAECSAQRRLDSDCVRNVMAPLQIC